MSNINKQALRESADSVIQKYGSEWFEAGRQLCTVHKSKIELIAAANPATVLALLDELEAKDKSISFLKDQLAQLANFNPDWDKLEAATDSLREHMAELTAARKRIAELEAVTPEQRAEHDAGMKEFAAMLQGAEPVSQPYTLPEGMVIVPVEPTREMRLQIHPIAEATCMECGRSVTADCEDNVLLSWADMLAAAPQQEDINGQN